MVGIFLGKVSTSPEYFLFPHSFISVLNSLINVLYYRHPFFQFTGFKVYYVYVFFHLSFHRNWSIQYTIYPSVEMSGLSSMVHLKLFALAFVSLTILLVTVNGVYTGPRYGKRESSGSCSSFLIDNTDIWIESIFYCSSSVVIFAYIFFFAILEYMCYYNLKKVLIPIPLNLIPGSIYLDMGNENLQVGVVRFYR